MIFDGTQLSVISGSMPLVAAIMRWSWLHISQTSSAPVSVPCAASTGMWAVGYRGAASSLPDDRENGAVDELARPPSASSTGDVGTRRGRAPQIKYGMHRSAWCAVRRRLARPRDSLAPPYWLETFRKVVSVVDGNLTQRPSPPGLTVGTGCWRRRHIRHSARWIGRLSGSSSSRWWSLSTAQSCLLRVYLAWS